MKINSSLPYYVTETMGKRRGPTPASSFRKQSMTKAARALSTPASAASSGMVATVPLFIPPTPPSPLVHHFGADEGFDNGEMD